MIPVYRSDGKLDRMVSLERLLVHAAHFRLVKNRRGHITRAYVKDFGSCDVRPDSRVGTSFEQQLPCGQVWALRGVLGSAA